MNTNLFSSSTAEQTQRYFDYFKLIVLLSLLTAALVYTNRPRVQPIPGAYIDPSLGSQKTDSLNVIVTATDSATAAQAVETVGGTVLTDLWVIDGVSATLTPKQLDLLAQQPGILTVINNKQVGTAAIDPYAWEGWATDRRSLNITHPLVGTVTSPMTTLLDGGVFITTINGEGFILNADGSMRATLNFKGAQYDSPPAIAADGTIYITGKDRLHSVSPNGAINWFYAAGQAERFIGLTLGNEAVFLANDKKTIFAFNRDNGQPLWEYTFSGGAAGFIKTVPAIGPDGTVYAVTQTGHVASLDPATGTANWVFTPVSTETFKLAPVVHSDGTIFVTGDFGTVLAINPDGTQKFSFSANGTTVGSPILASDGTLYVVAHRMTTEESSVDAINLDGTVRFSKIIPGGLFVHPPLLNEQETKLFVPDKNNRLMAFDASDGTELWTHSTAGQIFAPPTIAPNGNLHLGDLVGTYEVLTPNGYVVYRHDGFADFRATPTLSHDGSVFFHDDKTRIVILSRLPEEWDETIPHVEPTDDPLVYKVANPLSIDIGADIAHENGVTGDGVGIAVIDSGVYFDPDTINTLGTVVQQHFLGQAEFVGPANCADTTVSSCFSDYTASPDGFGHGTHVAGIIWNNGRDYYTNASLGIAPDAKILSIRVLDDEGNGSYADVIEGIQYVITNKDTFNIRVMNLSLSASATVPYFVDPFNRAVEEAWAAGIVVLAAAGNEGPNAQTITVPGSDPYIITIGALDSNKTPGYWADDSLPFWSSTGPTLEGFVKPDIVVPGGNIVSYMYNDGDTDPNTSQSAKLVQSHPDYAVSGSLFRMNGTSMATGVASGVVALMLEDDPTLTPDQVKFRLKYAAKPALEGEGELGYSPLQQGAGRIWVPDAVFGTDFPTDISGNEGLDITSDLAHGWMLLDENGQPVLDDDGYPLFDENEIVFHYEGLVNAVTSDNGTVNIYYLENETQDDIMILGAAYTNDATWIPYATLMAMNLTFETSASGGTPWEHADLWANEAYSWGAGNRFWSGGNRFWSGGNRFWSGGNRFWSGGNRFWGGGNRFWSGGNRFWSGGNRFWSGGVDGSSAGVSSTTWIPDTAVENSSPTNVTMSGVQATDPRPQQSHYLILASLVFFATSFTLIRRPWTKRAD